MPASLSERRQFRDDALAEAAHPEALLAVNCGSMSIKLGGSGAYSLLKESGVLEKGERRADRHERRIEKPKEQKASVIPLNLNLDGKTIAVALGATGAELNLPDRQRRTERFRYIWAVATPDSPASPK